MDEYIKPDLLERLQRTPEHIGHFIQTLLEERQEALNEIVRLRSLVTKPISEMTIEDIQSQILALQSIVNKKHLAPQYHDNISDRPIVITRLLDGTCWLPEDKQDIDETIQNS
jgi:hypothetical protein